MLPVETVEALFPSSGAVGKIAVRPLTLGRAALLETLGVDCSAGISPDQLLLVAWVLSLRDDEVDATANAADRVPLFEAWCGKWKPDIVDLAPVVVRVFEAAFSTFVPPAADKGAVTLYSTQTGFGWPLELAEFLMAEYGMAFGDAMRTPVSRVYALVCCARQRNGGKHGAPDYYERIAMARAAEHFRRMKEQQEAAWPREEANG